MNQRAIETVIDEITDQAGTSDADYSVLRAAAVMLINTRAELGEANDALAACQSQAGGEITKLREILRKIMARCADLLDEDQFNELDAMMRTTVTVSEVTK